MDLDDLVLAVQAGDTRAWKQLVPRIANLIRPQFRRHFGEADTNDLIQATLLVVFRKLPKFQVEAGRPVTNWVRTIARIQVQDELRKRGRRHRLEDEVAEARQTPSTGLSSRIDRNERLDLINAGIDELDSRSRRVVENDLDEGDLDEFADSEGIKRGSVRARRSRALGKLRRVVGKLRKHDRDRTPTPPKT